MSKSTLNSPTLVLNRSWHAIGTITVREAIVLLSRNSAKGTSPNYQTYTWEQWVSDVDSPPQVSHYIKSPNLNVPAPEVIILTNYNDVYMRCVRFSSRALFRRDDYICQYCRKEFAESDLSVDHVIPRAAGGRTNWENCVTACMNCNNKKADRSLKDAGLVLPKKPEKPKWNPIIHIKAEHRPESWRLFTKPEWWELPAKI